MTFSVYLSVAGLLLDFIGAAFLAYDVLYGPDARFQAGISRNQLAIARRNRVHRHGQLQELLNVPNPPEMRVLWLRERIRELTESSDKIVAELKTLERHELRARRIALAGLVLLMGGFACQGLANMLAGTPVGARSTTQ